MPQKKFFDTTKKERMLTVESRLTQALIRDIIKPIEALLKNSETAQSYQEKDDNSSGMEAAEQLLLATDFKASLHEDKLTEKGNVKVLTSLTKDLLDFIVGIAERDIQMAILDRSLPQDVRAKLMCVTDATAGKEILDEHSQHLNFPAMS